MNLTRQHYPERFYEVLWNEGEVQGTSLSKSHNKYPMDRIRGIVKGNKIVAGRDWIYPHPDHASIISTTTIDKYLGKGEFGKYFNSNNYGRWDGAFNELKDCVWKITYGDKVFDYLKFDSALDLHEFLNSEFLDDQDRLLEQLIIEAYFLERSDLEYPRKLKANNSIWGDFRRTQGTYTPQNYVSTNAWGGDPVTLENVLTTIWQGVYGGLVPAHTLDQLCRAFYLNPSAKRNSQYKYAGGAFISNAGNRNYWDGAAWSPSGGQSLVGHPRLIGIEWETATVHVLNRSARQATHNGARTMSYFFAYATTDNGAIFLKPFGVDTVYTTWFDSNEYEVQVVSHNEGESSKVHTPDSGLVNQKEDKHRDVGAELRLTDFTAMYTMMGLKRQLLKYGIRYHKKGTPFVSQESKSKLRSLSGHSMNNAAFVLEYDK